MATNIIVNGAERLNTYEALAKASSGIKPGMLVEFDAGEFDKHGVSGGNANPVMVAIEESDLETVDTFATATVFADGRTVRAVSGNGEKRMWLAASQVIVAGDPLESNGDGTLIKHVPADEGVAILHNRIVGVAMEAVTTGGAEVKQIRVLTN